MKLFSRLLLVAVVLLFASSAYAYQRTVLLEEFTATTCPPCYNAGLALEAVMEVYGFDELAVVGYHMDWPAPGDPWNVNNPEENLQRRMYYGVNAIPDVFVDGIAEPNPSEAAMLNAVAGRLNSPSPCMITIDPWFDGDFIHVDVEAEADEFIGGGFVELHVVLCEIHYHTNNPFPNNQRDIDMPMLDMITDGGAQVNLAPGDVQEWHVQSPWQEDYDITNLAIVAFIQDNGTREILNSTWSAIPSNEPLLIYNDHTFDDAGEAHPNGRPDAGETVDLIVELLNHELYLPATGISGTLRCDDENIIITDDSAVWPDITNGDTGENTNDAFSFSVPADYDPRYVTFYIDLEADGGYENTTEFTAMVGVPTLLFVNDYGNGMDYWNFYETIFEEAGVVPDVVMGGNLFANDLTPYETVIWATQSSDDENNVLNDLERLSIASFLSQGGNLVLTSQYAGDYYGDLDWFGDYFGINHEIDDIPPPGGIGAEGSAGGLLDGFDVLMAGGGSGNNDSPSSLSLDGAQALLNYMQRDDIAASYYSNGTFKTAYFGFPLEAVSGAQGTNTAGEILATLLDTFEGGQGPGDETLTVPLLANYFNLVSTHIAAVDMDAASVFGAVNGLQIVYQDDGSIYIPPSINTIGDVDFHEGYQVFTTDATNWVIEGTQVDMDSEFHLNGNMWNWLGFPYPYSVPIDMALEAIADDVEIVMTDDGRIWIPPAINTIGDMVPGEGYFVFTLTDLDFQYAQVDLFRMPKHMIPKQPNITGAVQATGLPYTILVQMDENLQSMDPAYLEVYDEDLLVGKAEFDASDEMNYVTAWGGSVDQNLPGFQTGHPITLNLLNGEGSVLASVTTGSFGEGAYANVTLNSTESLVPEHFEVAKAYPNPFNPTVTVPFSLPQAGEVSFTVYNVAGQQVASSTINYNAGHHRFLFDAASGNLVSGVYFLQVQFNDQVITQKVMLLK